MSRHSLRLDDGLLDRGLPHSSASFSLGGGGGGIWRSTRYRSLKFHRSQPHSVSCSESLLAHTPSKRSGRCLHDGSVHSAASDASLLSSLLDESTLVDTLWGLDHDNDPKESTVIADQSTIVADSTLSSDGLIHPVQTLSRVSTQDHEAAAAYASEHQEAETPTIYCRERNRRSRTARCRVVTLAESTTNAALHPSGSQFKRMAPGDGCREEQPTAMDAVHSSPWSAATASVSGLWKASVLTGKTSGEAFRDVSHRWPPSTSLLSGFPLLLLVLVPLMVSLLIFSWFGPAAVPSVLPAVDVTEWRLLSYSSSDDAVESSPQDQDASARLGHLEKSLARLWQHMEAGGQQAEQRHTELLQLYTDLQQRLTSAPGAVEAVTSQLDRIRTRLDDEGKQREQTLLQQQSQASRLDHLELQMQKLAARTEWQQEAAATSTLPAAASVDHDALLAEVARLEAAVEHMREDVKALSAVQDSCQQLDTIQQMISTRVSEEVRALVYGNQLTVGGGQNQGPESLLQWLSQQYVTESDLQGALASLERSLLQDVAQQLQQRFSEDPVRRVVVDTAGASVTQEDVHVIVKNALRLFSQDRTGLADYALESGGGSVLSTRCSQTYETKAALLSLFGLPLWYFSQSPRAVIQPDVHPGNCWAFRGSSGFLVIRLSMRILPSAFSLEHIPKALTPSGTLLSAPRDFSVYGLDDENQETGKLLGTYTYDVDGDALQTYAVAEENDRPFQVIEVRVLSNWGHEEYTCMYRFRVHGTPSDA